MMSADETTVRNVKELNKLKDKVKMLGGRQIASHTANRFTLVLSG